MKLEQIEKDLKNATDGLLMISETEEPFEFYHDEVHGGEHLTEDTVLKLAGMPAGYPLEVVEVDYFFRNMTQQLDANEAGQEERAERFRVLVEMLKTLQDVKAYRIGEQRVTVLIIGTTEEGKIAGLKTVLVET